MTGYSIEISPAAERGITDAVQWYRSKSPTAADLFTSIVFDSLETLSHSPLSWAKISDKGLRKFVLPRYPYSLFFTVQGSTVKIMAVAHHRRAPPKAH